MSVTAAGHTMQIARSDRGEGLRLFDKEKAPYQMKNIADGREAVIDERTKKLNEELVRIGDRWVGALCASASSAPNAGRRTHDDTRTRPAHCV